MMQCPVAPIRRVSVPFLACAICIASPLAGVYADTPCEGCSESRFPEAQQFLATQGFAPEQYSVLLTWTETAPADPSQMIAGYHVLPRNGGDPFDLYSDAQGRLIDAARLAALGVRTKDWSLAPKERPAEIPRVAARAAPPKPIAVGVLMKAPAPPTLALPAIDLDAVKREDAAGTAVPNKAVLRVGVFQDLPQPVVVADGAASLGAWQTLADGRRLWAAAILSPGARGQRIHFPALTIPAGGALVIYNSAAPAECYGPFTAFPAGENGFWSPTCFGESVTVECTVPAGADLSGLAMGIDRIAHLYRGFDSVPWTKSAGSCNLDVTCYPAWAQAARGVGGIGAVGATGILWCTGTLLVDTEPATALPYFLTAHHCVGAQDGPHGASNIEVYWLYQTPSCNGAPPSPATVPRTTGGADYLAGSGGNGMFGGGNDFTLLRLRNAPPGGLTYLGWSTLGPALGAEVSCIHHPQGDFKRYSLGTLSNQANPFPALYHQVVYSAGTTEPGSSGCPVMLGATQQVIGQLWGGDASCLLPLAPDFYGRFDVTFPVVQAYLDPSAATPRVDFSASEYEVAEAETLVAITVTLDAPPGGTPAYIGYSTEDGVARAGIAYEAASGTLVFDGTEQVRTFTITIHDDTHTEQPGPSVTLRLANPVGCLLADANNPATLTISDNDPDADADGLSDYDETHATYGYITDPDDPDTDGDGVSDYDEEMGTSGLTSDPTEFTTLRALSVPFFSPSGH